VGLPREVIDANLNTVMDLVELLREREERYVLAFADLSVLRVALDQKLSDFNAPLTDVREVAFFPPMTGG
ncbi:MAG: MoaD/ThiS family protein, partial [Alphaproteobacteria bacterium]|nr:MoaD/ThiS family protein [Alphaproteobacteria bacterium]